MNNNAAIKVLSLNNHKEEEKKLYKFSSRVNDMVELKLFLIFLYQEFV